MQRCSELPLPSSSSCTKRSPPATCVVLPEANGEVSGATSRSRNTLIVGDSFLFASTHRFLPVSRLALSFASRIITFLLSFFPQSKSIEFVEIVLGDDVHFINAYICICYYYCPYRYCTALLDAVETKVTYRRDVMPGNRTVQAKSYGSPPIWINLKMRRSIR